jgi:hypothetical protein
VTGPLSLAQRPWRHNPGALPPAPGGVLPERHMASPEITVGFLPLRILERVRDHVLRPVVALSANGPVRQGRAGGGLVSIWCHSLLGPVGESSVARISDQRRTEVVMRTAGEAAVAGGRGR